MEDPELGIDYSRVVHGEQRFAHTRPVRAGDALTVIVTLEKVLTYSDEGLLAGPRKQV